MRYTTSGESHGKALVGIIEDFPANMAIDVDAINQDLKKRQGGYGRGNRQKIEHDEIEILTGIRHLKTLGSPITFLIQNIDHKNWREVMNPITPQDDQKISRTLKIPRSGHVDLSGGIKYNQQDLRNAMEHSSARNTAILVAIGSLCKQLLNHIDIDLVGYVAQIGNVTLPTNLPEMSVAELREKTAKFACATPDEMTDAQMRQLLDQIKKERDTIGGKVKVRVENLPIGLGSTTKNTDKLEAELAQALMGLNAVKAVEIGDGTDFATARGSQVIDNIQWDETTGFNRKNNHMGGIEGGLTTGMPLEITLTIKPIPTIYQSVQSTNIISKEVAQANIERSDSSAVVPASVIAESITAIVITQEILQTFNDDEINRLQQEVYEYRKYTKEF